MPLATMQDQSVEGVLAKFLRRLFASAVCSLSRDDAARAYAFCMGRHARLGADSAVRVLPVEIIQLIFKFVGKRPRLSADEFFAVYQAIYTHCATKTVSRVEAQLGIKGGDLYDYIRLFLESHCDEIRVRLLTIEPVQRVVQMHVRESRYVIASKLLTLASRYIERHWILRQQEEGRGFFSSWTCALLTGVTL